MKNINCKHCQLLCKVQGKTECTSYQAKASRPEQLKEEIKEAFKNNNYELGHKLQEELFKYNHG
jgi:hypothetical protein